MTATPTSRRRWPQILATVAVVVVLAIAGIIYFGSRAATPTATPTVTSSPSATSTVSADPAPTGCLGGPARDAAMVLTAQKTAPHTTNGAVEVATAFTRWLNQYPYPSTADAQLVAKSGLATGAPTKDLVAFFASSPNLSGGLVPNNSPYYLSTVPGVYHLESAATDEVAASIGTGLVVNGELSATLRGSITVTVHWEGRGWKFVSSAGIRTTQDLYSIGKPFTGGC
jgi:hypothetical protein